MRNEPKATSSTSTETETDTDTECSPDAINPSERVLRARMAAYTLHSRYDSREITAPARRAFLARFETEVDPEHVLPPAERTRRALSARKAYFTRLAIKSAEARRKRTRRD